MTDEIVEQQALLGECSFCKSQVEKKKMTQHLKTCKQLLEAIALEKQGTARVIMQTRRSIRRSWKPIAGTFC